MMIYPIALVGQESATDPVAARVGDQTITLSQVSAFFRDTFSDREFDPALEKELRARSLQQLVDQHLVLIHLENAGFLATEDQVNLELDRLREQLRSVEMTLEQHLEQQAISISALRFNLRWQISWERYLDRWLTPENLELHFQKNRARLAGAERRVAHLLLRLDQDASPEAVAAAIQKANTLRDQIQTGALKWADAAREHSIGQTKDDNGDIGWIRRDGPMPRVFGEAVYELEQGEISSPVHSPFGVHLIQWLEERGGALRWYDAREETQQDAIQFLFEQLVQKPLPDASKKVEYTGVTPYFDPNSGELVEANK